MFWLNMCILISVSIYAFAIIIISIIFFKFYQPKKYKIS